MFDWFKKSNPNNVVPLFPENKAVPYIEPPKKDPTTYYSIGTTDDNRVTLSIGYNTLTMNKAGALGLIAKLEVFVDQLED
jgi:hypothetical protein